MVYVPGGSVTVVVASPTAGAPTDSWTCLSTTTFPDESSTWRFTAPSKTTPEILTVTGEPVVTPCCGSITHTWASTSLAGPRCSTPATGSAAFHSVARGFPS